MGPEGTGRDGMGRATGRAKTGRCTDITCRLAAAAVHLPFRSHVTCRSPAHPRATDGRRESREGG